MLRSSLDNIYGFVMGEQNPLLHQSCLEQENNTSKQLTALMNPVTNMTTNEFFTEEDEQPEEIAPYEPPMMEGRTPSYA